MEDFPTPKTLNHEPWGASGAVVPVPNNKVFTALEPAPFIEVTPAGAGAVAV